MHDVDHPVAEVERQAQLRMLGQEARHQRRHMPAPEAGRRRHPQVAAGLQPARADRGLGIGKRRDQPLAVLQERLPLGRQRQPPRGAQHQLHAQARLQRVQPPAHHRRRHAFGLRRGGEAALGGDEDEGLHLLELVHGRIVLTQRRKGSAFCTDLCVLVTESLRRRMRIAHPRAGKMRPNRSTSLLESPCPAPRSTACRSMPTWPASSTPKCCPAPAWRPTPSGPASARLPTTWRRRTARCWPNATACRPSWTHGTRPTPAPSPTCRPTGPS
mmetsp:Transcript_22390/g.88619  ORF Transcript_22390/g.88619 Transcript_22390/m.88619 type:complete len:272 (+) Transcript_22390:724-1539(+)